MGGGAPPPVRCRSVASAAIRLRISFSREAAPSWRSDRTNFRGSLNTVISSPQFHHWHHTNDAGGGPQLRRPVPVDRRIVRYPAPSRINVARDPASTTPCRPATCASWLPVPAKECRTRYLGDAGGSQIRSMSSTGRSRSSFRTGRRLPAPSPMAQLVSASHWRRPRYRPPPDPRPSGNAPLAC
jgi:hypothetical protein